MFQSTHCVRISREEESSKDEACVRIVTGHNQFHFEYSGAKIKKDNAQTENDKKTETIFHIENPKGKTTGVLELRTRSL